MEVEAVSNATRWMASRIYLGDTHAIMLKDTMNLLLKIQAGNGNRSGYEAMASMRLHILLCTAGVKGNDRAD